jgi:RNA polymerase sigma-70 factor (ECF subfamily)
VVAAYLFAAIRSRPDAEDVLQDVAAAAYERLDRYDPNLSFTGWVLGIARYAVLDHHRSARRDRHVFGEQALQVLAETHQRAEAGYGPRSEALEQCLKMLPRRQHATLMLRYRDNLKVSEIGRQLDTSANAVAIMLHRIRQSLSDCVTRRLDSEATHD